MFCQVDCEANRQLCMEHMIRAYPTIQTYTHGENIPAETYYGDRTGGFKVACTRLHGTATSI